MAKTGPVWSHLFFTLIGIDVHCGSQMSHPMSGTCELVYVCDIHVIYIQGRRFGLSFSPRRIYEACRSSGKLRLSPPTIPYIASIYVTLVLAYVFVLPGLRLPFHQKT